MNHEIAAALFKRTRSAVLSLLYGRSTERFYLREIARTTGTGLGPLQRELKHLTDSGILTRSTEGRHVYYQANYDSPLFRELVALASISTSVPQTAVPAAVANASPPQSEHRPAGVAVPQHRISTFCQRNHICQLALFGSVLRPDFRADSDIDVLVEFEPGHVPGFDIVAMEDELSEILGRKVDLRTPQDLSRYFRDQVIREARIIYGAA